MNLNELRNETVLLLRKVENKLYWPEDESQPAYTRWFYAQGLARSEWGSWTTEDYLKAQFCAWRFLRNPLLEEIRGCLLLEEDESPE